MFRVRLGTLLALLTCQPMLLLAAPPARTDVYGDPLPDGARVRMGTIQLRHGNADVTFAADGKTLISCGRDGTVCYWDMASGKLVRRKRLWKWQKDKGRYRNVTLACNGKTAAAHEKGKIYLYNIENGREKGIIEIGSVSDAWPELSPDGKLLAVRTNDDKGRWAFQLWDVAAKKRRPPLTDKKIDGAVFSPQGNLLATRTSDNALQLWDTASGKELRSIEGVCSGMVFSPDGKTLAAIDVDRSTVHLWDTASGKDYATLPVPDDNKRDLLLLTFSADGSRLAGLAHRGLIVWDVATRKVLQQFPDRLAMTAALAPDGRTLACWGIFSNEIRLWDVATGKQKHERPGHGQYVYTLAVSPDGKIVASGALHDPCLYLWDAATGRLLHRLKGGDKWIQSCVFSADGKQVASCGCRGTVQLWDVAAAQEVLRLETPGRAGNFRPFLNESFLRFTLDGKRLNVIQVGTEREDTRAYVWDAIAGKLLSQRRYKVDVHSREQPNGGRSMWIETHAAFTPDGKAVTVRREKRLAIEETTSGQTLALLPENVGWRVAFSPDGQLVAAAILKAKSDPFERPTMEGICLIEAATGQEVLRIETGQSQGFDFSTDGRLLAKVDEKAIRILDIGSGAERFRRAWPEDAALHPNWAVSSLAFLPDGEGVVTGMSDGTLLVWDVPPCRIEAAAKTLDDKTLETLWSDLAGNAGRAHRAVAALSAAPARSVPFLAARLRPAAAIETKRLTKLLADLDSEQFPVREKAARQLLELRDDIDPALRRFLHEKPSLEARRRLKTILDSVPPVPRAATLRTLRAIRVLESIGTTEARRILGNLAEGAAEARATRAAKSALARCMKLKSRDR